MNRILDNKRIFIIEDNLVNRSLMQLLLEGEGAQIAFERWGVDFLKRIEAFSPVDLIILDLQFPEGVNGYDIFQELRAQPKLESVPIIAVSAKDPELAVPRVQALGFSGFIPKPISFENFPKQIAHVISGQEIWLTRTSKGAIE